MSKPKINKIRKRRLELNWSLDYAAQEIGISKTYLWELEMNERSNPSFEIMKKISATFGRRLEWFQ